MCSMCVHEGKKECVYVCVPYLTAQSRSLCLLLVHPHGIEPLTSVSGLMKVAEIIADIKRTRAAFKSSVVVFNTFLNYES